MKKLILFLIFFLSASFSSPTITMADADLTIIDRISISSDRNGKVYFALVNPEESPLISRHSYIFYHRFKDDPRGMYHSGRAIVIPHQVFY